MATAITENPMASAIVTAQTEIHMIGTHDWFTAQRRAYGDLVPAGGYKCRTKQCSLRMAAALSGRVWVGRFCSRAPFTGEAPA